MNVGSVKQMTVAEADRIIGEVWRGITKPNDMLRVALRRKGISLKKFKSLIREASRVEVRFPRDVMTLVADPPSGAAVAPPY